MTIRNAALATLGFAAILAGAGLSAVPAAPASAQTATASQQPAPAQQTEPRHLSPTQRVEGRIAYLKAVLKLTSAQEPQFDRVAQAMRENARDREQAFQQFRAPRGQPESALDRLEMRTRFAAFHAQASQRLLVAFKPLYASLNDDQKKTADTLLSRHHFHRHGRA